jgi:excisionase family DNA binding protein
MRSSAPKPGAKLLSFRQASDEYGIATSSLRRLVDTRKLPAVELPGIKRVLLRRDDLDALIESSTRPAA